MNNNEAEKPKTADIVIAQNNEEQFKSFGEYAGALSLSPVLKTNCKLCMSKFRNEVEEMFARDGNILKIHRFLLDKGEQVSYPAVRNHLEKHYREPFIAEKLKDYAEDLNSWSRIQQEKEERIKEHMTILDRQIKYIDACTDKHNITEQRKSAEVLAKLVEQIGKEEERLEKLKRDESPVTILLYRFEEMIKVKVNGITSPELKVVLLEILDEFAKTVEELENEE
jgi:hypothetical protein